MVAHQALSIRGRLRGPRHVFGFLFSDSLKLWSSFRLNMAYFLNGTKHNPLICFRPVLTFEICHYKLPACISTFFWVIKIISKICLFSRTFIFIYYTYIIKLILRVFVKKRKGRNNTGRLSSVTLRACLRLDPLRFLSKGGRQEVGNSTFLRALVEKKQKKTEALH